ncbi:helix-turn-helix domain-containing protein, partial [Thomasclavelia cocleata]
MDIGDRLRELRKERRLTQNDVETLTGIKRSSLALYELGAQTPPI